MGQQIPITASFHLPDGQEVVIETGKLATQSNGSVVVRVGKTMLFATAVGSKEPREGQSFFPLSVDYQEKFASAGRIPGNFFRREARLSDNEVLISRLVDRAIRPLFPDGYMNDTQIIINLISGDKDTLPDAYAALAASAALSISDIPFQGPISEVRVARIRGAYHINPSVTALAEADLDLIVAATEENIMMVEGEAKEVDEQAVIEALKVAHDAIRVQCRAQKELVEKVGKPKMPTTPAETDEALKAEVAELVTEGFYATAKAALDKQTRKEQFEATKEAAVAALTEKYGEEWMAEKKAEVGEYIQSLKKSTIRNMMLTEGRRLDGRRHDEIRPIWCEIDYLPSTHGSAIFTRGETQALTSLTLGTKLDEAMIDNALGLYFEKFILHYNFPGFSVGEVKPMRGPGRREVGHANLAARSLRKVMPQGFPYTTRIVSDILESNGSSSMATVCAGSLALMDAGVPISAQVAGIAMGLITDGERFAILSDILGDEDALGDMDFKLTGTANGITACQMDIKIDGLPYEILEKALLQARDGRLHILSVMNDTIAEPREDMKPHAPRIVEIIIDKTFIGAVIGPGGKIIQEIQETTGTIINIEEKNGAGYVNIASPNKENIDKAVARIKGITAMPEPGDIYDATVKSIMPYGAFVEFMPGKEGLLHVSELSYERVENVSDVLSEGDVIKVKLLEVDPKTGKFRLSTKALLPKPEGYVEREERRGGDRDRGDRSDRGPRHGGGGGRGPRR